MNNQLVSIIVITYNSEKYVLETLDSIKNQTYQNIELIISDDASKDKTIEICQKWIEQNKSRFINTKLITIDKNSGIPANCNRGVKEAKGEIIKLIAGDDCFFCDGIDKAVSAFSKKMEIKVLQTTGDIFNDSFFEDNKIRTWDQAKQFNFFEWSAQKQYLALKYNFYLFTPAIFFKKEIFNNLYFDEEFKTIEDYPFWILLAKNGFKFYYEKIKTVKYRKRIDSVQQNDLGVFSIETLKRMIAIQNKYYKNISVFLKLQLILRKLGLSKDKIISVELILNKFIFVYNIIYVKFFI